jgi:nitrogen fixation/metabolism regulation signal transduction histidine kinase
VKRISTRLVISFLIVTLLPTLPLSLVVVDLLERRFGPAIADPMQLALEAGLNESRGHLRELRTGLDRRAAMLALAPLPGTTILLDAAGRVQPPDSLSAYLATRPDLLSGVENLNGSSQRRDDTLMIRIQGPDSLTAIVLQPLPAGMVTRAGHLTEGVSLLRAVRANEGRVVLSFVGPFLVVYGVLIVVALIAGVLWSRQMVRPLEMLVGATRRVARGDLEFRMEKQGPGEVGELVHSFDTMVSRLADQRRDLARLERAAAWRSMARTLAHEVKNPLTPILLSVNQVRDKYSGDDEVYQSLLDEVVEIVGEEVESLRGLVKEFGDFARLPKPELKPGDMGELLRDLEQLYGRDHLELQGLAEAGEGWFDYGALRRALINLIDNGLAASRQAGQPALVQLMAIGAKPGIRLAVRDQGVGIPETDLKHIFEPDFTTKSDGMGLGLAIVENIIIGHGGIIGVQSEPGRGTTFTIDLPLTNVATDEPPMEDGQS